MPRPLAICQSLIIITYLFRYTYVVYVSQNDTNIYDGMKFTTKNNSLVLSSLEPNQVYYAAVAVKDSMGYESPLSEKLSLKQSS